MMLTSCVSKLLRLGIKNKRVCFVLRSTFRNSDFVEVTTSRKCKEKQVFLLHFTRLFVILQHQMVTDNETTTYASTDGAPHGDIRADFMDR